MQARTELTDPLRSVTITNGFWAQIIKRTCSATLPHVLQQCEDEGHIRNIRIAAGESDAAYAGGADRDSDLFKVMEGTAYCLGIEQDAELERCLDTLIDVLARAQQPDGYLQSYYTSQKPEARYTDLQRSHELYCAGHCLEAAVAHFETTGKRKFLEIAVRLADHLDATFGPGKREIAPGHQGVEMALVRLAEAAGASRYLDLARYFVDMRGNKEMVEREYGGKLIIENDRTPGRNRPPEYRQDHLPVTEQREATGHAVRAGYLYAAMADIAMACDSEDHVAAAKAIWDNVVSKKLYLSGGVGTHQYHDEGFGDDYVLPNTGYCETCGGIAFLLFSHRMGLLTGEAQYADVVELILYNHVLSSTDLSGCLTFYRNPLSSQGPRERHPWDHPACCPTNIVRLMPQFARFAYAVAGDKLYVDQFASSTADVVLDSGSVQIQQQTNYPWDGSITITVTPRTALTFGLHIRIPGWLAGRPVPSDLYTSPDHATATISVNGAPVSMEASTGGYCVIDRTWHPGDQVVIELPMHVHRVYAHPEVEADRGRMALMRGPLLYCFEEADLGGDPEEITLSPDTVFEAEHVPGLLKGVTVLKDRDASLQAVPFCVWNNREPGRMAVWMNLSKS